MFDDEARQQPNSVLTYAMNFKWSKRIGRRHNTPHSIENCPTRQRFRVTPGSTSSSVNSNVPNLHGMQVL
jgi:hypothetical protein